MKQCICFIAVSMVFVCATASYSMDVNLGVNVWYAMWLPEFEESFRGKDNAITASNPAVFSPAYGDTFTADPCLLAGPVIGLRFSDRWSIGLVFLVSMDTDVDSSFRVTGAGDTYTMRYNFTFWRYDGDLTVTYRTDLDMGIFAGLKYLRWENTGDIDMTTDSATYTSHTDAEVTGQAMGPAIGLNYSRTLTGMLFLTGSLSAMFLKSKEMQDNSLSENGGPAVDNDREISPEFIAFNFNAGLGYFFSFTGTTFILGGRCQYMKNEDQPGDVFYGVTLSAVYSM